MKISCKLHWLRGKKLVDGQKQLEGNDRDYSIQYSNMEIVLLCWYTSEKINSVRYPFKGELFGIF